jgi:hypothetical protein
MIPVLGRKMRGVLSEKQDGAIRLVMVERICSLKKRTMSGFYSAEADLLGDPFENEERG